MSLKPEIMDSISRTLENEIGMTYEEFEKLNFDEQQGIIEQHRQQKRKQSNNKKVRVISSSVIGAILIFVMMLSYTNYIYATDFSIQDDKKQIVGSFEANENVFDIERIIETNSSIKREKKMIRGTSISISITEDVSVCLKVAWLVNASI